MKDSPDSTFLAATQRMAIAYPPDEICALTQGEGSFVCRVYRQTTKQNNKCDKNKQTKTTKQTRPHLLQQHTHASKTYSE